MIQKAIQILSDNDVVIAPTETVYGLFCDATSDIAVRKVYSLKGRPSYNPLIAHVSLVDMALLYAQISDADAELICYFWDELRAPITFVVPLLPNSIISRFVTAGLNTIAIRKPNHPISLEIIKEFGRPLAAPSANTSKMISPTSYDMVMKDLGNKVRLVIDGGMCCVGIESTIIDITSQDEYRILRPGGTPREIIEKYINRKHTSSDEGYKDNINLEKPGQGLNSGSSGPGFSSIYSKFETSAAVSNFPEYTIKAPGMLKKHYAPGVPLRMNAYFRDPGEAFIAFGKTPIEFDINLSESSDLDEAAMNLYDYIKKFDDSKKYKGIAVMPIPNHGIGEGINDRLRRASYKQKRVILIILDGFGISENTTGNAAVHAKYIQNLIKTYPSSQLKAHGKYVGLPDDQFGNSEVGHMTIGTGRIHKQKLPLISDSIASGEFDKNPELLKFIENIKSKNIAAADSKGAEDNTIKDQTWDKQGVPNVCHIMGLFSNGGVHSHIDHFFHGIQILREKNINIKAHLFLDGRDVAYNSALSTLKDALEADKIRIEEIATVHGRYYAMDRDKKLERTQISFDAIRDGKSKYSNVKDPISMINTFYNNGIYDEEIYPFVMDGYDGSGDNDSFWMLNFRTDRIKQILFMLQGFNILNMVSIDLEIDKSSHIMFPTIPIKNTLGEIVARNGLKQLRVAETEKYAHVTYFINGGEDITYENEDRILVNSPKVSDYSKTPDMSSQEITENVNKALVLRQHDLIIANYASPDMIGHTGVYEAAVQSMNLLDNHIKNVVQTAIDNEYEVMITSDHGNIESMINEDSICKTHTCNPVPFIYIGANKNVIDGSLADIAPTILEAMSIEKPNDMTGESLIKNL